MFATLRYTISGYILANILLSINQLKRFVFETSISSQDRERQFPVQGGFRQVCQALFEHRESLEEVVVSNSDGAFSVSAILRYSRLNTFTNLKILAMSPFHKLYYKLHERLPPSLEILQLQYAMDHEETDENLDYRIAVLTSLAANKVDYVPQLKHVIW